MTRAAHLVARLGGDEFVVLRPRATDTDAQALASHIADEVARPFAARHRLVTIGISVGVALSTPGDAADRLLAAADRHMYGVKAQRRVTDRVTTG